MNRADTVDVRADTPVSWGAWEYRAALAVALLLVVARSFVFVWFEQADFDSDQAILGLMAKHLAEGRAFPLFQYGLDYGLAVETWCTVPVFWLFGPSVLALKGTVLALNGLTAWLLMRLLCLDAGLRPFLALAAGSFFFFPPPITSATLVQALGMNIEPFVAVLLLWMTRRKPALFGAVFAVGFFVREFAAYGLLAILILEAAEGSLLRRDNLRAASIAACTFAAVWAAVAFLRQFSSPFGPGSVFVAASHRSNLAILWERFSPEPALLPRHLYALAAVHLPNLFGLHRAPLPNAGINAILIQGTPWLAPVAGIGVVAAGILAICRVRKPTRGAAGLPATSDRGRPDREETAGAQRAVRFCAYVFMVGAMAALTYALGRGPRMGLYTMRYLLLALLAPIGIVALSLRVETSAWRRAALTALVVLVVGAAAMDHARLAAEYRDHRPPANYRALANYLDLTDAKYGEADYWTAYQVVFLARERVTLASTGVSRISEYDKLLEAHRGEAVRVMRTSCPGGRPIRGWYVCPTAVATSR
jgi:hypothetical protein